MGYNREEIIKTLQREAQFQKCCKILQFMNYLVNMCMMSASCTNLF